MKFTVTVPVSLGGIVFPAGEHEANVEKDWFFDALVSDGALTVTEDDTIEAVVVDTKPRKNKKAEDVEAVIVDANQDEAPQTEATI